MKLALTFGASLLKHLYVCHRWPSIQFMLCLSQVGLFVLCDKTYLHLIFICTLRSYIHTSMHTFIHT
eukprot:c13165_g1_i1 orf=2-199(-)